MNEQLTLEDLAAELRQLKVLLTLQSKIVLTLDECCLLTGLSKAYMYQLTHANKIPYYKPGGKKIYFKRTEVEAWLLTNRVKTAEEIEFEADAYLASIKHSA